MRTLPKRIALVALVAISVVACAKADAPDQTDLFNAATLDQLGNHPLAQPEVQKELRMITNEIQNAMLVALIPEYGTRDLQERVAILGCKPLVKLVLVGISIEFVASDTCKLNGTVSLKLFPATAVIDLDVVGLAFIDRIQLDAEGILNRDSQGVTINLVFLNGHVSLKEFKLFPISELSLNGRVNVVLGSGSLKLDSRINGFDPASGTGVALIAKIDGSTRTIQGCLLGGARPDDPDAGTANACFKIGG